MRSHSQTLDAVKTFVDRWKNHGYEKGESQKFWMELLHDVLDVDNPGEILSFENQVKLASTSFIDAYIAPTKVLIEQKSIDKDLRKAVKQSDGALLSPFQQAKRYAAELPVSKHPRWVVTCNFKSFLIYDMENPHGEPEEVLLEDLEKDYYRLRFLVEDGKTHLKRELEISIKAGELVGKLYDAFLKQYQTSPTPSVSLSADISPSPLHSGEGGGERKTPRKSKTQSPPLQHGEGDLGGEVSAADLHSLNVLCVRLVFCLYAEDAGIFSKDQFYDYMAQFKPSQMNGALRDLFTTLDTKIEERPRFLNATLKEFPYVNGSLFQQHPGEDIPPFDEAMSELLLKEASLGFDWSEISPTIFGAVFESTLNPETRRSGGMHYTSIENIHKVIDPLFLNDLKAEFEQIKQEKQNNKLIQKLEAFQNKIASLTFLDPACGSGNFLTETYISLRRLENEVITLRHHGQKLLGFEQINPIKVNIHQFYGIEINDFAVTVATTALWIAESQMMHETERIIKFDLDYLPLKSFTNIHLGNALRMDWNDLTRPQSGHPLHSGEGDGFAVAHPDNTYYKDGTNREFVTYGNRIDNEKLILAKQYRKKPTPKEAEVWEWLRNKKMLGLKWRRQQVINGYIADFYCTEILTVLEIDGEVHDTPEAVAYDENRTDVFAKRGIRTIRIKNNECTYNNVKKLIESVLSNSPLQNGEGVPAERAGVRSFDYIMGNPPFVGYSLQSKEQKDDILSIYVDENGKPYKTAGKIDYVSAWYFKATQLMQNTYTQTAFVSTNSITQGEQVAAVWKPLYDRFGIHINFAHRTFRWDSEASLKAHVHCVIVGFSTGDAGVPPAKQYTIYDNERALNVDRINPYLVNADDIWIESRKEPLCEVPLMTTGNRPADGGHLIIEANDYDEFVNKESQSKRYIKRLIGSEEFINNKIRYCLWLVGASPAELRKMPEVLKRIEACRQDRLSSPDKGRQKLADTPHLFRETQNPEQFMIVPKVSSENRRYVPMGFFDKNTISTDLNFIIPNVTLYHFGVLTSNVHMAWMRAVCGRLEMRYRYSKDIVYNNFPWPSPTDVQKSRIEATAQAILDARALYPDSSLADLYDEVTMPPELRRAHQNNDRAVMEAYGFDWRKMTESECVAELFKLYQKLTSPTPSVSLSADISPSPLHSGEGGGKRKTPRKSKTQSPPLQHGEGDLGGEVKKRTRKKTTEE